MSHNLLEEGTTRLVFSRTLNDVFNRCSARVRVALNKQDNVMVSGRYRILGVDETVQGDVLNFDFKGAEIELIAEANKDGLYNISTKSYVDSSVSHRKFPNISLPTFCVNTLASEWAEYENMTKEEAIAVLKEFDEDMANTQNVARVEDAPYAALHYNQHLKM
ncbi:MAG: hypothetical protein NZ828_00385 [Alphaproteobacteria bacterium]|nr:hypothetical protein [Alphaproteobacteria bacterium]